MRVSKRMSRRLAGVCVAALVGAGVARAQTNPESGRSAPPTGETVAAGPDVRVRIAHGLAMAIEGSTLQELALQAGRAAAVPGTTGSGAAVPAGVPRVGTAGTGTFGSPAGTVGSGLNTFGRDPTPARPVTGTAASTTGEPQNPLPVNPEAIAPGSTTKLPGVGVTGRNGARATTSASFNAIAPSGRPGADNGVVAGQMAAALSARPEQLMQEARLAFEASENLLRGAGKSTAATERLRSAADRYARSLRSVGSTPAGAAAVGEDGAARPALTASDRATLALINHAVKEAADSFQIKQVVRMSAGDSAASRALLEHARRMDAASRQTIDGLAPADESGRRVGTTTAGRGGLAGMTLLAQQAREVLDSIRELDGLDGPAAGARPTSGDGVPAGTPRIDRTVPSAVPPR